MRAAAAGTVARRTIIRWAIPWRTVSWRAVGGRAIGGGTIPMGTLTMSAVTLGAILVTRTRIGTVLAAIPGAIPMTASLLTPATGATAPAIATLRLPVFRSTIRVFAGMTATIPPAIA
jgi:hypothetical protein